MEGLVCQRGVVGVDGALLQGLDLVEPGHSGLVLTPPRRCSWKSNLICDRSCSMTRRACMDCESSYIQVPVGSTLSASFVTWLD